MSCDYCKIDKTNEQHRIIQMVLDTGSIYEASKYTPYSRTIIYKWADRYGNAKNTSVDVEFANQLTTALKYNSNKKVYSEHFGLIERVKLNKEIDTFIDKTFEHFKRATYLTRDTFKKYLGK